MTKTNWKNIWDIWVWLIKTFLGKIWGLLK